ncbi:MAG: hypothetical protein AAF840_11795, partial [Bacteroidota bacterium]
LKEKLVYNYGVSPSILLNWPPFLDNLLCFPKALDTEEIDDLLLAGNVSFFEVIEVSEEAINNRYKIKVNPLLAGYDEFLCDYDGDNHLQFFTKQEATEYYLKREEDGFYFGDRADQYLALPMGNLTDHPKLFQTVINISKHLSFTDQGVLSIAPGIDLATFNQLNALLKTPILIYVPHQADDYPTTEPNIVEQLLKPKIDPWLTVKARLAKKHNSVNTVRKSEAYLQLFIRELPLYHLRSAYFPILKEHFLKFFPDSIRVGYDALWQGVRIEFYGVAIKSERNTLAVTITAAFGVLSEKDVDLENPVAGTGADVETAYQDAFRHWLLQNRHSIVEKLNQKSTP